MVRLPLSLPLPVVVVAAGGAKGHRVRSVALCAVQHAAAALPALPLIALPLPLVPLTVGYSCWVDRHRRVTTTPWPPPQLLLQQARDSPRQLPGTHPFREIFLL